MSSLPIFTLMEKMTYIINSGIGRDKACRIIQYFLMGILPALQAKGAHYNNLVQRLSKLKGSMSQTRKVLRFGKEIPLITGIRNRLALHEQTPQRMILTRTISDIALILYFATDHPLYLHSIGFKTYEKTFVNNLDYINNVFWLMNSVLDIVCTIADMQHLQNQIKQLSAQAKQASMNQTEEQQNIRAQLKDLKAAYIKACLNVARNALDLPVICYFMKHGMTASQAGFLGCCSSAISLYGMWGQK